MKTLYKRILLKLSGEGLAGDNGFGIDSQKLSNLANQIQKLVALNIEVCIVVGGGNFFRGAKDAFKELDRSKADQMGMLATLMNAVALHGFLNSLNIKSQIMSGLSTPSVCETYSYDKAMTALQDGNVVIFAGGTGNPYFTTDTGAVLRAIEMHCDVVLKSSQVDGIYSADPKKDAKARKYDKISYEDVIAKNLKVMDLTAISLAKENNMPLIIFSQHTPDSITNIIQGKGCFSVISNQERL